jgi:hypothetical protein
LAFVGGDSAGAAAGGRIGSVRTAALSPEGSAGVGIIGSMLLTAALSIGVKSNERHGR